MSYPDCFLQSHPIFRFFQKKLPLQLRGAVNVEAIRLYITGTKFRNITGDPELTDVQVLIITELLDEMSPKSRVKFSGLGLSISVLLRLYSCERICSFQPVVFKLRSGSA